MKVFIIYFWFIGQWDVSFDAPQIAEFIAKTKDEALKKFRKDFGDRQVIEFIKEQEEKKNGRRL